MKLGGRGWVIYKGRSEGDHLERGGEATVRVGWRGWEVRGWCMAYAQQSIFEAHLTLCKALRGTSVFFFLQPLAATKGSFARTAWAFSQRVAVTIHLCSTWSLFSLFILPPSQVSPFLAAFPVYHCHVTTFSIYPFTSHVKKKKKKKNNCNNN